MEVARNRTLVAVAIFGIGLAVLGLRLFDLGFIERVVETSPAGQRRGVTLAARADIVDRNGIVLATNLSTASLYADQKRVIDPEEAADKLVMALPGLNRSELATKLRGEGRFVWIKRNLTPEEQWRVNNLGIPGLAFEMEDRRVYPHGRLASHILGFVDIDGNGLAGTERYFNKRLGDPAHVQEPLKLAVDFRVQHVLHEELENVVRTFSAVGGAGVVLDARSGEVLAMVSLPDYDPNVAGSANQITLFNRAVQGVYELGSGLKTFTVAMALDSGVAKLNSSYDATRPLQISRFRIHDDHPKARWLSLPEVFMYSSNIGSARMGLDLGTARQRQYLGQLGLLNKPKIELFEAASPLVPNPWGEISTMTVAFGHGLAITPLHLASGMGAVVNGGRLIPATLLADSAGNRKPDEIRRIVSPETSETMRRLLRLVVLSGTGSKANVPGFEVGGKTGTAEKPGAGGYKRNALISSFVGAFPMDNPRYVVMAIVDEPKGTKETYGFASGGWTAAPAVARIITRIAPMLGVAPREHEDQQQLRQALLMPVIDSKAGDH
ncbi:peptidoglycan D,D-transpeptidase FtsI family protein [Govanella unica]|uniref:Penicillin-binding protein 2 n=1 Tax=Govanella unica TaxID=2975056 RepID=A0A9X3U0M1_9PROT|nr:penicillin-binding protein 2 [Govania unica]MDA5195072.1 penicillin-binding protein 2 [Govania unica]